MPAPARLALPAEWSLAVSAFLRPDADDIDDDPGREPTAEELAAFAARKAEVETSEDFRARNRPSENRKGVGSHFWEGGRSGTARRHGDPSDPGYVPTTPAEAARRAIRDFRRATRPRPRTPKEPPLSATNGALVDSCPDCGTPYGKRRRCYNASCPSGRPGIRPGRELARARREDAPETPAPAPAPAAPKAVAPRPGPSSPALRRLDAARRVIEALDSLGDPAEAAAVLDLVRLATASDQQG